MTDETAIRVENDSVSLYKVRVGRHHEREMDDGIIWLREQYREEHGSEVGFEAYAREAGFITPNRQKSIDLHESSLDERLGWVPEDD